MWSIAPMTGEEKLRVLEAKADRPHVGTASGYGLAVHVAWQDFRYDGPDRELTRDEAIAFLDKAVS